ncbi:uncharacterized protein LOC133711178 [Rosa rugosa]|uniref:uncharacterized protein LOC133711178 n=1 Tax=Rosa rugosa TaxID=74645 RepID=UPI002B41604D|nr:uncharacterized protein LOC133711178 [Rosa rugosa]
MLHSLPTSTRGRLLLHRQRMPIKACIQLLMLLWILKMRVIGDFFLEVLAEEFAKHHMRRVTFISDRRVGLVSAFPRVFPNNSHGFCFRHLMSNLSDKFPAGSYLKDRIPYLFMCCAYSRTPEMYEFNMEILRSEGGDIVAQFLEDLPKENWCMAYFNGERFGEMTNNLAESFNNWVLPLKSLPILDINDGIRVKSMASIAARKQDAHEWLSELCPVIEKKLKDNLEVGRHWRVSRSDTYVYEVHCQKYNSMVNLETRFCSCGEWQLYGFPCSHALVVIQQHGSSTYLYVNELYKVDKYRETYSFPINPLPSISKQVHAFGRDAVILQPPLTRRPPRRPRKKSLAAAYHLLDLSLLSTTARPFQPVVFNILVSDSYMPCCSISSA